MPVPEKSLKTAREKAAPLTPSQRTVQDNFNIRAAQFLFLQRCVPSFFMALI